MQNDDITWGILNRRNCAFKLTSETQKFCRNEYNVTGLCARKACPLANSQYATVRESKGKIFLYIREAERVYTPNREWRKIKMSQNLVEGLQQIEDELVFWPLYFRQKCRQRLLKIKQYLARMRKLQLTSTKKVIPVKRKEERRLARREEKALIAAKLNDEIEKGLLNRLKEGTYERIYNFPKNAFNVGEEEEEYEDEEELEDEYETMGVKEEVEEDEEMSSELREELERDLVRVRRGESDSEDDDDDDEDIDSDVDVSDLEGQEVDSDEEQEAEEEDEEEVGHTEYVADFDESDEEENRVDDIEDMVDRLGLKSRAIAKIAASAPSTSNDSLIKQRVTARRKLVVPKNETTEEAYRDMKYAPKILTPAQKGKLKKLKAKRRLDQFVQREKERRQARMIKLKK